MGARRTPRSRPPGRADTRRAAGARPEATETSARERILLAALQVFAEQGFDGARTRDIAERASANLGLIQYYFEGKEQLWRAAVSRAFEELQAQLGEVVATRPAGEAADDDRARLARVLRHFVRFVARRPEFMRLMNDEGKRDGSRMRWLADHHVRPFADALRDLAVRAQASGSASGERARSEPPLHRARRCGPALQPGAGVRLPARRGPDDGSVRGGPRRRRRADPAGARGGGERTAARLIPTPAKSWRQAARTVRSSR